MYAEGEERIMPPNHQNPYRYYPHNRMQPRGLFPGPQQPPSMGGRGSGGLLAKIFNRTPKHPSGFGPYPTGGFGSPLGGAGGGLSKATNVLGNVQQVLHVAQQAAPIIQQYGPMIKNIPTMIQMWKLLQSSDNEEEEEESKESNEEESLENDGKDSLDEIFLESINEKDEYKPKRKNRSRSGQSTPKLYI